MPVEKVTVGGVGGKTAAKRGGSQCTWTRVKRALPRVLCTLAFEARLVYLRLEPAVVATAEVDHAFVACAASPGLRSQSGAHLVPIACREGVRAGDRLWPAVYSRARGTGCVG